MDNPSYPRRSASPPSMFTSQIHSTPAMLQSRPSVHRSKSVGDHQTCRPEFPPPPPPEKLTLPLFVARFHDSLPLCVRVCRGFCGPNEEMSISEGDHFSIHFVKHTTVVAIECENGNKFNVPLNSAVHFGLLYDPYDNHSEAVKGYKFEKVSDILRMPKLPLVVRARKCHQGSNPESSIAANELLVLRRVRTKLMGRKELKLYSVTTGREKTLNDNCIGHFSTKPREVSMYIPEIVKHVPDVFPCKAVLFNIAGSAALPLPSKLSISAVTLMHSSINTSLVATSVLERDLENAKLLDIPIDLDILVRVVGTGEMEAWRLHKDTSYLYDNFNPANLCPYVSKATSQSAHETQSEFYVNVCPEQKEKYQGIKVTKPQAIQTPSHYQCPRPVGGSRRGAVENIYHSPDKRDSSHSLPDMDLKSDASVRLNRGGQGSHKSDAGVLVNPGRQSSHKRRTPGYSYVETNPVISARPMQPDDSSRIPAAADPSNSAQNFDITSDTAQGISSFGSTGSGGAVVERIENDSLSDGRRPESVFLDSVITEFQQISQELDSALVLESHELEAIEETDELCEQHDMKGFEDGDEEIGIVTPKLLPRFEISPSNMEASRCEIRQEAVTRNRKYLSQMDAAQVLRLLDAMGMEQYQETFIKQQINGDILSECDDDILQNELRISSRLHRMRWMRIISGQYSVKEIMSGKDGYVLMLPAK